MVKLDHLLTDICRAVIAKLLIVDHQPRSGHSFTDSKPSKLVQVTHV